MNSLELINLEKHYGNTKAVCGVSLSLPKATYCCLLGPSGCGKTGCRHNAHAVKLESNGECDALAVFPMRKI